MTHFKRIKPYRVSGGVAEQLKEAILLGVFKPGDKLPSERDLAIQFGVSRLAILEACRTLENSGFVQIRQGVGGGTIVTEPDFDHLLDILFVFRLFDLYTPDFAASEFV